MSLHQIGYHGQLRLSVAVRDGMSYPTEVFYTPPFKLANYFRLPDGGIEYMLMNASAGIMAGDNLTMHIDVASGGKLLLTSQSYEKIHKMEQCGATRTTHINIASNGYLCYNQLPIIPFLNADFTNKSNIYLADTSSKLIFSEIVACGRVARNEIFAYQRYHGLLDIYSQGVLVYRDNSLFIPSEMNLAGFGFYENYTHSGSMVIYGFSADILSLIESSLNECAIDGGVSQLLAGGYLLRAFSHTSESLIKLFSKISEHINLHQLGSNT